MMKSLSVTLAIAAGLPLAVSFPTAAQADYPERPAEFVVPWPPGDLEDVLTRMIADKFQETYGVPAAVVNKPGGGGGPFPGAVEVAMAPADGYTIGSFVISVPVVGPNIGIEPLSPNPFDPVGIFLTYPFITVARGDAAFKNMQELAGYAKDQNVTLGHFGKRSLPRRHALALASQMGFSYGSDASFDTLDCNTLASGDADVITTTVQAVLPCLKDVTVLYAMTNERIATLPEVPAAGELAPDLDLSTWNGLFVHKDTPQEARDAIAAVAKEVMESDAAAELSKNTGAIIYWKDRAESEAQIAADIEAVGRINALVPMQ